MALPRRLAPSQLAAAAGGLRWWEVGAFASSAHSGGGGGVKGDPLGEEAVLGGIAIESSTAPNKVRHV
jgi:hypothetical protein